METLGLFANEICNHADMKSEYNNCTRCPLSRKRTRVVFWSGPDKSQLMAIGEAPGRDEDRRGFPFAGRAGVDSLNPMLRHLGINRGKIHLSNACLCRPTDGYKNLTPNADELRACRNRLKAEIRLTEPDVIVTMGKPAAASVLEVPLSSSMTSLRGWHEITYTRDGIPFIVPVMCTWHPAYELRATQKGNKTVRRQLTADWAEAFNLAPSIAV